MKKTPPSNTFVYHTDPQGIVRLCSSTKVDCPPINVVGAAMLRARRIILVPLRESVVQLIKPRVLNLDIAPCWVSIDLHRIDQTTLEMRHFMALCKCSQVYLAIPPQGLTNSAQDKVEQLQANMNLIFEHIPTAKRPPIRATRMVQNHYDLLGGPEVWINDEQLGLDCSMKYALALEAARIGAIHQLVKYINTPKRTAAEAFARFTHVGGKQI